MSSCGASLRPYEDTVGYLITIVLLLPQWAHLAWQVGVAACKEGSPFIAAEMSAEVLASQPSTLKLK